MEDGFRDVPYQVQIVKFPQSPSRVAPQQHIILLSCAYHYSDCVRTLATSPAEGADATKIDFDDVDDDEWSDENALDGEHGWACDGACFMVNCLTRRKVLAQRRSLVRLVYAQR